MGPYQRTPISKLRSSYEKYSVFFGVRNPWVPVWVFLDTFFFRKISSYGSRMVQGTDCELGALRSSLAGHIRMHLGGRANLRFWRSEVTWPFWWADFWKNSQELWDGSFWSQVPWNKFWWMVRWFGKENLGKSMQRNCCMIFDCVFSLLAISPEQIFGWIGESLLNMKEYFLDGSDLWS